MIRRLAEEGRLSGAVMHGGLVYLAGQVADDATLDTEGQTADVLAQIDALLAEAGSDRSRLLTETILLSDMSVMPVLNAAWDQWVVPGCAPTRTSIQAVLASPDYALEIVVNAAAD